VIDGTARADEWMTIGSEKEGTLALPVPDNSRFELRVTAASVLESFITNYDFLLL